MAIEKETVLHVRAGSRYTMNNGDVTGRLSGVYGYGVWEAETLTTHRLGTGTMLWNSAGSCVSPVANMAYDLKEERVNNELD